MGVSAVVAGYIYHFLVGNKLILSAVCSAGVESQEEDRKIANALFQFVKKNQLSSSAADESYMGVINTGAAWCERTWWCQGGACCCRFGL